MIKIPHYSFIMYKDRSIDLNFPNGSLELNQWMLGEFVTMVSFILPDGGNDTIRFGKYINHYVTWLVKSEVIKESASGQWYLDLSKFDMNISLDINPIYKGGVK